MHEKRRSLSEINLSTSLEESNHVRFKRQQSNLSVSTLLYNQIKSTTQRDTQYTYQHNYEHSKHHDLCSLYKQSYTYSYIQSEFYHFFERPYGYRGFIYKCFTFTIILISILFSAFTTFAYISKWAKMGLFWIELFVTLYLFIEYCIRVWSSGHRTQYCGLKGRIKFMSRIIMIIELIAFFISLFVLILGKQNVDGNLSLAPTALTVLRILQLIRLLYVDRQAQTWVLLVDVIQKHRFELITSVYIGFITLLLSSYLILIFEKPYSIQNDDGQFHTYSDALYFSIITMATIGYGDRTPRTYYGKLISTSLCIIGVAFWTLPGGIIGSGLALRVEQKKQKKQFNRLVPAAASLIQSWWRMKAVLNIKNNRSSLIVATLKVFQTQPYPLPRKKSANDFYESNGKPKFIIEEGDEQEELIEDEKFLENKAFIYLNLKPEDLLLIRTILLIKFHVAKRKFKHAHEPYDFKDVIEQYTQGNMDILIKLKDLQRKLDQTANNQKYQRSFSLNGQIKSTKEGNLVEKLNTLEDKLENIEHTLDLLLKKF